MESIDQIVNRINSMINFDSNYFPFPGTDIERRKTNFYREVLLIEKKCIEINSSTCFYYLGLLFRNYAAMFTHDQERVNCIQKQKYYLQLALNINTSEYKAKEELSLLLIEEKSVRNLELALSYIESLKGIGYFPSHLSCAYEKAKRWLGQLDVRDETNFINMNPVPGMFTELRTKYRKQIREALKKNNLDSARVAAKNMYNLALLRATLYDEYGYSMSVNAFVYDFAKEKIKKYGNLFHFSDLGKIGKTIFLSDNDYKYLEKVFEKKNTEITFEQIHKLTNTVTCKINYPEWMKRI